MTTPTARLTLQAVQRFISTELPRKLEGDLAKHLLAREADIECSAYMHLRQFFGEDSPWKVLARRYIPQTKRYIDLVIFRNYTPCIAIEIKWGSKSITAKDRTSLNDALTCLGVNKVYWLSCSGIGAPRQPLKKNPVEKYVLKQLVIRGSFDETALGMWKLAIPQYRKKLSVGKGRKLVRLVADA